MLPIASASRTLFTQFLNSFVSEAGFWAGFFKTFGILDKFGPCALLNYTVFHLIICIRFNLSQTRLSSTVRLLVRVVLHLSTMTCIAVANLCRTLDPFRCLTSTQIYSWFSSLVLFINFSFISNSRLKIYINWFWINHDGILHLRPEPVHCALRRLSWQETENHCRRTMLQMALDSTGKLIRSQDCGGHLFVKFT